MKATKCERKTHETNKHSSRIRIGWNLQNNTLKMKIWAKFVWLLTVCVSRFSSNPISMMCSSNEMKQQQNQSQRLSHGALWFTHIVVDVTMYMKAKFIVYFTLYKIKCLPSHRCGIAWLMIAKTTFTHIQTDQFHDMIPTHNFQSFQYSTCLLSIKIIHSPTGVKEAKMTPKQYLTIYIFIFSHFRRIAKFEYRW